MANSLSMALIELPRKAETEPWEHPLEPVGRVIERGRQHVLVQHPIR